MSNPWQQEDDEDMVDEKKMFESVRDNVVFLIDCSPSMLEIIEFEETSTTGLNIAMEVVEKMMKTKIMATPDDNIGVIFFNTKIAKNEHHFVGVHQFIPLANASSATVEKISNFRNILTNSNDLTTFHSDYGCLDLTEQENSLGDTLWFADTAIRSSGLRPQDTKRVLLFTKNDSPFGTASSSSSSSSTETRAMSRSSDMGGTNKKLHFFFF